jgi:centractin
MLYRDVTEYLQLLLRKSGYNFHTTAEKEVVRIIKEKTCYIPVNPVKEEKETSGKTDDFMLPDGNVIRVSFVVRLKYCSFIPIDPLLSQLGAERFRAPEILFQPELIGQEYLGIHQVIVDSINRADLDLRKSLYSNVVLSGGSTLCRGFGERLLSEVKKLALKDIKIKIYAPPERKYSTWIGGSILASLSTFKKVNFCSKFKYAETLANHLINRCGCLLRSILKTLILYTRRPFKELSYAIDI